MLRSVPRQYTSEQRERQRQRVRDHYQENKQYYLDKAYRLREQLWEEVRQIKGSTPCSDCGVQYPYWVMQFDHRGDEPKKGNINKMVARSSRKTLMAEIAKCDVVCANCHFERTHQRYLASSEAPD